MSVHGRSRLLKFVDQQAIVGVCFEDVKRLSEQGVRFPFDVNGMDCRLGTDRGAE